MLFAAIFSERSFIRYYGISIGCGNTLGLGHMIKYVPPNAASFFGRGIGSDLLPRRSNYLHTLQKAESRDSAFCNLPGSSIILPQQWCRLGL
jgi:hypothetical protein